jgi:hypothetical protein
MKRKLTPAERVEIIQRLASLEPVSDIAEAYSMSRAGVCRLAMWALYRRELVLS